MYRSSRNLFAPIVMALLVCTAAGVRAETALQFNLPAQPLADSLRAVGSQTNINVLYDPPMVAGYQAPALNAKVSTDEALTRLLEGTGLAHKFVNEHTVVLSASKAAGASVRGAREEQDALIRMAEAEQGSGPPADVQSSQEAPPTADSSPPTADIVLEEVTVTATKRKERIKDVPLSVTAISGEELALRGIDNAQGLSFAVPGLSVNEFGAGRQFIVIRGVSSGRGTSSLTGVYLDEIPVSGAQDGFTPAYPDLRTYDLERVEVLKGPQGTLFGEGAVGGVIRYVTRDPQLSTLGGELTGTFYDTQDGGASREIVGVIDVPIAENVFGIRAAATYEDTGGWIDKPATGERDFNDNEVKNARVKALWRPTPELAVRGLVNVHRNEGGGTNVVDLLPFDASQFQAAFDPSVSTDYTDDYDIYNLTATYDLKFAELLSSTSHLKADSVFSHTQFLDADPVPSLEILIRDYSLASSMTSQELRLASSGSGPFKWLVGANYKKSDIDAVFISGVDAILFGGTPDETVLEDLDAGLVSTERSQAWAGFGDASYLFMDRLEVGGGLRYFYDRRERFNSTDPDATFVSGSFDAVTYRAYARYAVSDNVNVYFNTANGFRSGGFNNPVDFPRGAPETFDPEDSVFYEIGIKTAFPEHRVGFDLALFKGTYEDRLEDLLTISSVDGDPLQFTVNTGEAEIEGFEWLLNWRPVERLELTFSGDVIDTENTQVNEGTSPVIAGDPLNYVPKNSLMLSANQSFNWAQGVPGYVDVSFSRHGKQYATFRGGLGLAQDVSPQVEFLEASVGAEWNGIRLSLFGRNLLDERQPVSPSETGSRPQARPRSFGVTIGKEF